MALMSSGINASIAVTRFGLGAKPGEIAERLYLTILSRFPTEADVKAAEDYAKSGATQGNNAWLDLAWALINSPEFLLRH